MGKIDSILEKMKNVRRDQWIVLLLAGILVVIVSLPSENRGSNTAVQAETEAQTTVTNDIRELERRLANILRQMEGAGNVQVMINQKDNGEKVVEKDTSVSNRSTQEDGGGTIRNIVEQENQETTIYGQTASGGESPYVTQELAPQIEGVLVLAEGADNASVKKDITDAVMALFGLEAHKIKVMKMK